MHYFRRNYFRHANASTLAVSFLTLPIRPNENKFNAFGNFVIVPACSQIKSDTDKPKEFLSDDALEFDLVGRVRKVDWVIIDSSITANDANLYKGYYRGTIDSVELQYDSELKLMHSQLFRKSLQTYEKDANGKIIFQHEQVLLDTFTNISNEDLSQSNYRNLIRDNKLVDTLWMHRLYYNEHGDIKEGYVWDRQKAKKTKQTERIEYKYQYDKAGNRTERIIISGTENERYISQIAYRKIEYQFPSCCKP